MRRFLPDEAATNEFGRALLDVLPDDLAGWTLLLYGELGTGKSTFARAFIRGAGHTGAVPSPTYTLVEPYLLPRGKVYHVDLYRVADAEELRYLGWHELDDGCRIVEWPDRAPGLVEEADFALTFTYEGTGRHVDVSPLSDRARKRAKKGVSHLIPSPR